MNRQEATRARARISIGSYFYDLVDPACLPEVTAAVEGVLSDGKIRSYRAQEKPSTGHGEGRWYETCIGPVLENGSIIGATLVSRDVTDEVLLLSGRELPEEARRLELAETVRGMDFGPVQRLLEGLHEISGFSVLLVSAEGRTLASTRKQAVCTDFFREGKDTKTSCLDNDAKVLAEAFEPGAKPIIEYQCPQGLHGLARSLKIDGLPWASIIVGQFRLQDEDSDPSALRRLAASQGWDEEAFLNAVRDLPVYDREKALGVISFASELGDFLARQTLTLVRERRLARHYRMSEEARADSERRYRLLADNAGDVIWTLDVPSMRYSYISPSVTALRGMTVDEALVEDFASTLQPASREKAIERIRGLQALAAAGDPSCRLPVTDLYEMTCKDGSVKTVEITAKGVFDEEGRIKELVGITRDATQRIKDELAIKDALVQKDVLFGELQHRVKNSLALIASLLSLESVSISDGKARTALESARSRIDSVAQLYQQLYSSRSVSSIRMDEYLRGVAGSLLESLAGEGGGIRMECQTAEAVLDTKRSVSLGLILNELVVNAIKYGCPGGKGLIRLSLSQEGGMLTMSVSDDGPGLPEGFVLPGDDWNGGSLGLTLIQQLASQLSGSLSVGRSPGGRGACFSVAFPLEAGQA